MNKKDIPEVDNKELSSTQKNFIENLFKGILSQPVGQNTGLSGDDAKQLEAMKWVLALMSNREFIRSATNLPEDELDDINDALMINQFADCPELKDWIDDRLELARSRIKDGSMYSNLLQLLSDISGKSGYGFNNMNEQNMIMGKLRR